MGDAMVVTLSAGMSGVAAQSGATTSVEEIRKEVLQLPYYSVFDFLAFKYDRARPRSWVMPIIPV
jgi:hypothetical protein